MGRSCKYNRSVGQHHVKTGLKGNLSSTYFGKGVKGMVPSFSQMFGETVVVTDRKKSRQHLTHMERCTFGRAMSAITLLGRIEFTIQTVRQSYSQDMTFLRETHKVGIGEISTSDKAKETQDPTLKLNIIKDSDEEVPGLEENLEGTPPSLNNIGGEESEEEEEDSENLVTGEDTADKYVRLEDTTKNKKHWRALTQIGGVSYNPEADRVIKSDNKLMIA